MQAIRPSGSRASSGFPAAAAAQANPALYFVYSTDNKHVGPVDAELIARGVLAGKVPEDAYVAPAGTTSWAPLKNVPPIAEALRVARSPSGFAPAGSTTPSSMRPSALATGTSTVMTPPPPPPLPRDLATMVATTSSRPPAPPTVISPNPFAAGATAVAATLAVASPAPPPSPPVVVMGESEPAPLQAPPPASSEEKSAEKMPALDPRMKLLPVAIFGACAVLGLIETAITLIVR
jgi:uncharacterized protein DUF4339